MSSTTKVVIPKQAKETLIRKWQNCKERILLFRIGPCYCLQSDKSKYGFTLENFFHDPLKPTIQLYSSKSKK